MNSSSWTIDKTNSSLTVSANSTRVNGTLIDGDGNPIRNLEVNITVDGVSVNVTTGADGSFALPIDIRKAGDHSVSVTFTDSNYNSSSATTSFNVVLVENATVNDVDSIYNTSATFNGTFTSNNETGNVDLTYTVRGTDINGSFTTDGTGKFSFTVSEVLAAGSYTVDYYHNSVLLNSSSWTIDKANSTLVVSVNGTSVNGTLMDSTHNTPISGATITIDLNGTHTVLTDSEGKYTFEHNITHYGTYPITVTFNNNNNYNVSTANDTLNILLVENITVNPVNSVYNTTTTFNGLFTSNNFTSGEKIIVKVDGAGSIEGTINTDGSVSFTISSTYNVGEHELSFYHHNVLLNTTTWNISKANSSLTVSANGTLVNGTLVDGDGNPIRNLEVNVTVDGVSRNVRTDNDGKFALDINVTKAGDHSVSVTFTDSNYNSSSATTSFNIPLVENITANDISSVFNDSSVSVSGVITSNNVTVNTAVVVKVDSDSREYSGTISSTGAFTVIIGDVYAVGDHILSFYHNNILLNTSDWNIAPARTNISVSANNTLLNGTLIDTSHNTPIVGGLVTYNVTDSTGNIMVSGNTSTDSNGKYNVVLIITFAGTYDVNVKFQNNNYSETSNSTSFTISIVENITTIDTSVQANATDVQLNATYTSTGIIGGVTITIKIKDTNITINTTTDTTGKITFNIPIKNKLQTGNYTLEYYHGTTLLNTSKITILPYNENITTNHTTAYYNDHNIKINAQYTPENMQGTIITLKINGQNITTATIATDGKLIFNIPNKPSLEVGNYTLEYYHGDKLLNTSTLTIKPVTTTIKINTQKNKIIGTLIDTIHNQPIPNTKVYYQIKDAKGNVVEKGTTTTDSQGKFTIPLNPSGSSTGTYTIDVLYPGNTDYNATVKELIIKKNGTNGKNDTKKPKIPMRRTGMSYPLLVLAMLLISTAIATNKRKN